MSYEHDEVLEGFLCPICMEDLVSIAQLQVHFEEEHGNEDKAVLQSLKGCDICKFLKLFLNTYFRSTGTEILPGIGVKIFRLAVAGTGVRNFV